MMQVLQSLNPGYLGYYLSPHVMTLQLISDDMLKLTVAIFKYWWKKDISQQMPDPCLFSHFFQGGWVARRSVWVMRKEWMLW